MNIVNLLPSRNIADHSCIMWNINICHDVFDNDTSTQRSISSNCSNFDKFDVSAVPVDFMSQDAVLTQINEAISNIECSFRTTQSDIDVVYSSWCEIVKHSMYSNLPYKYIDISRHNVSRKQRTSKAWWSDNLTHFALYFCN
ncbi:hypothetical protein ACF0H5_001762 [Mactra antiquata]